MWRRRSDSNRRIEVLQTSPLPLGYAAPKVCASRPDSEASTPPPEHQLCAASATATHSESLTKSIRRANDLASPPSHAQSALRRRGPLILVHRELHVTFTFRLTVTVIAHDTRDELMALLRLRRA